MIFYVSLIDQSDTKLFKANPTIASGDCKVSIDGGAFANLGTLPTVTPASGRGVKVTLSQAETNGDNLLIVFVDAAGAEWCDLAICIPTAARQIDDLAYPATTGRSLVVDAAGLVDANAVKVGPTGAGTAQTAGDLGLLVGADAIETGVSLLQANRYIAAALCGKIADAETGTETYKGIGVATTRLTYTVDSSGNRSVVTLG